MATELVIFVTIVPFVLLATETRVCSRYQNLNLVIVNKIVKHDWVVFVEFARELGLRVEPRRP